MDGRICCVGEADVGDVREAGARNVKVMDTGTIGFIGDLADFNPGVTILADFDFGCFFGVGVAAEGDFVEGEVVAFEVIDRAAKGVHQGTAKAQGIELAVGGA